MQLSGGMPTIAVRDLAIQQRENDLVAASFGRGFYVLDDYAPLRAVTADALEKDFLSFAVKPAWMYIPSLPLSTPGKAYLGDSYFTAPNPPFGAVFTYYLRDEIKTRRKARLDAEKEKEKKGEDTPYPDWDELRKEDREEEPAIVLTVTDEDGDVVRRLTGPVAAGFQRVAWDLRYPPADPTNSGEGRAVALGHPAAGSAGGAGDLHGVVRQGGRRGDHRRSATPQTFDAEPLGNATLPAPDRAALLAFQQKTGRLQRAVLGAVRAADEAQTRLDHLKKALLDTPAADAKLRDDARAIEARLKDLKTALSGDSTVADRNEPTPPAIVDRVQQIVFGHWSTTAAATATHRQNYDVAAAQFAPVLGQLRQLVTVDLKALEDAAEAAGAPWTPGRVPTWTPE